MTRSSRLLVAVCLACGSGAAAGCASDAATRGRPSPFPGAPPPAWTAHSQPPREDLTAAILDSALALQGRPYLFGGADPRAGFDCSGLVWYVYASNGLTVPRTTAELYAIGRGVDPEDIAPGDLVFFSTTEPGPSHVGIALDQRTIIHAPNTGGVVRVERFDTDYWWSRLTGVRRLTPTHLGLLE